MSRKSDAEAHELLSAYLIQQADQKAESILVCPQVSSPGFHVVGENPL